MNKVIGIGNAIIDIVCEVNDEFLLQNRLVKGGMSLIDEDRAQKLSRLETVKITSGGSVANTIATLAQLGASTSFIGTVGDDKFGKKFIDELTKSGADFLSKEFARASLQSARSFILVTKDAQRTMCTFLGCASEITQNDITERSLEGASMLYLEGYLWNQEATILSLKKAITIAKNNQIKIAFTLSDKFCVTAHRRDFIDLINHHLDFLFANESEIHELLNMNIEENIAENSYQKLQNFFANNKKLIAVITMGEKGCAIFSQGKILEIKTTKVTNIIDTTGAGDCFAAGFLYGVTSGFALKKSGEIGNLLAGKIIQKFGARFISNPLDKDLA
jgi:fructokinase